MRFLELILLRLVLWVGLPVLLLVLMVGPARVRSAWRRTWKWLWERRLDPQEVLTRVVQQQEAHVLALKKAMEQAEQTEKEIGYNLRKSEEQQAVCEREAQRLAENGDDLGARAALYKVNLEKQATESFREQRERQQRHITEARRRLYQVELQLRQYEVGRSILLSQLAEARTVEQQLGIIHHFDPFQAIANWQKAEGIVQEKALTARAVEQVYADTLDVPAVNHAANVDQADLDTQLAELKEKLRHR